jgi:hypothetical protein
MSFDLRILLLLALTLLAGCSNDTDHFVEAVTAAELDIRSVTLTPDDLILNSDETQQMTFMGILADNTQHDLTKLARWETGDSAVLTVDSDGLVTARQDGVTFVRASYARFAAQSTLRVSNATLVSLEITGANQIDICKPLQLGLIGHYSDGTTRTLSNRGESWSVTPATVAAIDTTGKLTVTGATTDLVEAVASKDGVTSRYNININHTLTSISLSKTTLTLEVDATATLTATGLYAGGSQADLGGIASWSSSVPAIATVEPGGAVTAVAVGATTISAECGGIKGSSSVTVTPRSEIQSIEIESGQDEIRVKQDNALQLTVTAIDGSGNRSDVTDKAEWSVQQISGGPISVSNADDTKGEVDTSKTGEAFIKATYENNTAYIKVIVE